MRGHRDGRWLLIAEKVMRNDPTAPDRKLRGSNVQVVKKHAKSVLVGFTNAIDLGTTNEKPFLERSSLSSLKALGAFLRRDLCGLTRVP
jgi:hypothetical protein